MKTGLLFAAAGRRMLPSCVFAGGRSFESQVGLEPVGRSEMGYIRRFGATLQAATTRQVADVIFARSLPPLVLLSGPDGHGGQARSEWPSTVPYPLRSLEGVSVQGDQRLLVQAH